MATTIDIQQQAPASHFKRLTLTWIIIAILLVGTTTSFALIKIFIERDQHLIAGFIGSYLNQSLQTADFDLKHKNSTQAYTGIFTQLHNYYQVERLSLYNTQGAIIWSSSTHTLDNVDLPLRWIKKPRQGIITIRYTDTDILLADNNVRKVDYFLPWLPNLILPVHGSSNTIIGIVKVTRIPDLLIKDLLSSLAALWIILILAGIAYYLFFYRLFMRTTSELIVCELDLEQSRKLAELGEYVSMIVHDTRNLMASIQFILERLRSDTISTERRDELINGAKRPLQMSFAMMEDMLAFVSGKKPPLVCHKHYLKELIIEGRDMLMATLDAAGHKLVLEIPDDLIIYWDAQKLLHILVNLVRNASEAMQQPGQVFILATRFADGVRVQVRDTGHGIPEKLLPNLFEPFISEPGKARPGLGLAIIRDLVRRQGGEVTACNWDQGAEFDLYFPDCPTE